MADLATWKQRKEEAEAALHALAMGQAVTEIGAPDGSRTRYTESDMAKLEAYLQFLDRKIAEAASGNFGRKPIYLVGGR